MTRQMTPPVLWASLVLAGWGAEARDVGPDLPAGATVRFQGTPASELPPGWHDGTVLIARTGCAMVATPDARMPGGRRVLGLVFVEKLQRQGGGTWVDVEVKALMAKEPKPCREGAGG